ncbi:14313_t:CDS:2 [Acaulospora colombiana]|uniref:14313_t:CDS:1 n=1 Tax=Acaulospora colombiana TaxID=27376 RepID=A0ACA9LIH3_9GLOM|nr:14313_t:CDS:2 [Acaulospora colombiana]
MTTHSDKDDDANKVLGAEVLDIQQNHGHKAEQDFITIRNMQKITGVRIHSSRKQRMQSNDMVLVLNQAVMETLLAFLNHFPLFAFMLRFKDSERLPGGLRFEICDPNYFASHGIARVVQGIKSFWPWSDQHVAPDSATSDTSVKSRSRRNRVVTAANVTIADSDSLFINSTAHTATQSFPPRVSYLFMQVY